MKGIARTRWLVMDVDGTLTDGRIYMGPDGELFKAFDIKDGYAIHEMLPQMGIEPVIITARQSAIVERRCQELGITRLYQGVGDKLGLLNRLVAEAGLTFASVCYAGDDVNDLPVMAAVTDAGGIAACPSDAAEAVLRACDYVCERQGGRGAIRELVEWLGQA